MRRDCMGIVNVDLAEIQGYHSDPNGDVSYAYQGFRQNKYFTSDRFIPLDDEFRRPDGKPLKGYGLEIETSCNGITNSGVLAEVYDKIIFSHFPADLFKMQHDGSLRGSTSAECITQVGTQSFFRNNYKNFRAMFNTYFPAFSISADSARTTCGMHVNISNACFGDTVLKQEEAIRKMYYIVNKYYDLCLDLFYRKGDTGYCARMDYDDARTMSLSGRYSDHYCAFNLGHYDEGRIELRLVGGQKNYACFRNTMESVFFLVNKCRKLSWDDCDDLAKIFKGCNQYVYSRLTICEGLSADTLDKISRNVVREELV